MKHSLFIAFIFLFSFPSIYGQKIECGFENSTYSSKSAQNVIPCNTSFTSRTYFQRACLVKEYEQTYDYNSKHIKYVPVVFHVITNIDNTTHVADFQDIEDKVLIHLSGSNQDYAGLKHINDSLFIQQPPILTNSLVQTAIDHTIDTKIRFVLPNKDPDGNCTNGIIRHELNQAQYDSLFHRYSGQCGNAIVTTEDFFANLDENISTNGNNFLCKYFWPLHEYVNIFVIHQDDLQHAGRVFPDKNARTISLSHTSLTLPSYYRSKILTHELGHLLDLSHTHYEAVLAPGQPPTYFVDKVFENLDVCDSITNQIISVFAPDNPLVTGNTYKDIPENVIHYDSAFDDNEPELYPDAHLLYGYNYPNFPYYAIVNLDETNTSSGCISPFNIQRKYYSPDFNFMSYNGHVRTQFSPYQILRMHSILEDYSVTTSTPYVDNANLWSQSNLENIGILKGPDDNTPLEITNAVTYNCPITLIGEVIIKTGSTLTLNDVLMYSDNACLTIEPGGQLIMPNGPQTSNTPYLTWVNNNCSTLPLQFQMRALLEGFYDSALGEMETELQNSNILPLVQPFNADPWYYNGAEAVIGHSTNTSDWVLLRLFDNSGTVVEEQAALINKFGYVTTVSGDPILQFNAAIAGQTYRISIHHKGHLAAIADVTNGGFVDFTRPDVAQGFQQTKDINGIEFLYGGDYDGNGIINNLDYNLWALNSAALNQYLSYDGDGNAIVNNLDYNLWEFNKSKIGEPIIQY